MRKRRVVWTGRAFLGALAALALALPLWARAEEPPALRGLAGAERERVAKLIEGARREAEAVWLSHSVEPDVAAGLERGFRERYGLPAFRLRHSLVRTGPLATRVLQSARAGVRDVDIIHSSDFELFRDLHKRNLLMKYDSPEFAAYDPVATRGEGPLASAPGYFTSAMVVYAAATYNTNQVKGLRSHEDVLDPRYGGRIVLGDASKSAGHLYIYMALRQRLPRGFWERLARQRPVLMVSMRDIVNRVGTGEYWLGLFIYARYAYLGAKGGLPVGSLPLQPDLGVVLVTHPWGILASAPHPDAAKLFTDYFHGREAQQMLVKIMAYTPGRRDVEMPAEVRGFSPPLAEMPALIPIPWKTVTRKELQAYRDEFRKIFYEGR